MRLWLLGFGFFGINTVWPLYNAYVPIFLKSFGLSSFVVGGYMTIDNIFALVLSPYVGALSDQTVTKLGKRKPYILIGAPLAALFFFLIPVFWTKHNFLAVTFSIIFMNLAMALFRSPLIALMPDTTPSQFRSQANGIINFMGGLGAMLAYLSGRFLYEASPVFPFFVGSVLLLLSNTLVILFVKEPACGSVKSEFSVKETFRKSHVELLENLKEVALSPEKSLLFMLVSIFIWFTGFNALETFFTSYAKFYLKLPEQIATGMLGVLSLAFMLFAVPAGYIGARIGRKRSIVLGLIITAGCLFVGTLVASLTSGEAIIKPFLVLFIIGGMGWALTNVNSLPMVLDMAPKRKLGGYTGLYYFASMLANIISPPLTGLVMDVFGYRVLFNFAAIFVICSSITVSFVKRGDRVGKV
ncbi:MAG: Major facilitator superfamily MFS_1 [Thermotoga sp. 50_1627]|nr:MAG: Major facilitator superfamily MFS_1 [Thermotoga sp. 50_64]KUK25163.1 MAG: Major facilitator superfamily MFS_1 [Thermotoga sp. 50_1627]